MYSYPTRKRSMVVGLLMLSAIFLTPTAWGQANSSNYIQTQGAVPQQQAVFARGNELGNADDDEEDFDSEMDDEEDFDSEMDEQARQKYVQRENEAAANFDAIMVPQNTKRIKASPPVSGANSVGNLGLLKASPGQHSVTLSNNQALQVQSQKPAKIEMPMAMFEALRKQVLNLREKNSRRMSPAVVLGAATYSGKALVGALKLSLDLQVTLGRPGVYKTVPLVGDDVVLVSASVQGKTVPVSRKNGYHVWVTKRTGELDVKVEILVPQRGPRGSIEYDFLVDRTPVTKLSCFFPVQGLEPRINASVRSVFTPGNGGTLVQATLRPTVRIHLLGLKDLGEQQDRQAKVYAESLNLLSVEEDALELFSVIRFTILYAGTKNFSLVLPKDMDVVSADGVGAFRYNETVDENGNTVLKGQTAFPIRNRYEISLRLRKKLNQKGSVFSAPLPKCLGVERQTGWLAVEVPGKLQLEEKGKDQIMTVTVAQLPPEMVKSAVSPILKAYRYHGDKTIVRLAATKLPDIEPKSASIDRVRAFTKLSSEGSMITDMRITLRNRLLPHLRLSLPKGAKISSAMLDGTPFTPSRDDKGNILLALKRSSGRQRLKAFTISVIIEQQSQPLGFFGFPTIELPAIDLPVSVLAWSVFLPARNRYSSLEGDVDKQVFSGRAAWHRPMVHSTWGTEDTASTRGIVPSGQARPTDSAELGAMPVRFKIPRLGKRLEYQRFWLEAHAPVQVTFGFVRAWLRYPAWIILVVLASLGLLLLSFAFKPMSPKPLAWTGALVALIASWTAIYIGGLMSLFFIIIGGLSLMTIKYKWISLWLDTSRRWRTTLKDRFKAREHDPEKWRGWPLFRTIVITIGLSFTSLLLLGSMGALFYLLMYPLA